MQLTSYPIQTDFSYYDSKERIKPYAYQHLFAQLVDQNLIDLGHDMNLVMTNGFAWVLCSLSLEVKLPITRNMTLFGQTWYADRRGPYFRREYRLLDENHQVLTEGASYSILLDLEKRSIFRQGTLPFEFPEPDKKQLIEASPSFRQALDYQTVDSRQIYPSTIDGIGHVNNVRYGEFAYDALTDEEIDRTQHIKRLELYFASELSLHQQVTIQRADQEQSIYIRGAKDDGKTSFDVVYSY